MASVIRRRFLTALLALLAGSPAIGAELDENQVKAAVVYHLSLFADWPGGSAAGGQFNLCVLTEDDNMAFALEKLHGKTVKGVPVLVWRKRPGHDLTACHMIYVGIMSETARMKSVAQVAMQPVLSVVNGGIPVSGAIVSIGVARDKVYFDIDLPAAQRVGLRLDAKLLRLARSVTR